MPAERRAEHLRRLLHDRVEADRVRQILARDEARHERLPRGQVERADRGAQRRQRVHRPDATSMPLKASRASPIATMAEPVCVISISLRRSHASATTPLIIEKTMIGTTLTRPTAPSARPFCDLAARAATRATAAPRSA